MERITWNPDPVNPKTAFLGFIIPDPQRFRLVKTAGRRWNLFDLTSATPDTPRLSQVASLSLTKFQAEEIVEGEQVPDPTTTANGSTIPSTAVAATSTALEVTPSSSPLATSPTIREAAPANTPILGEVIAWNPGTGQRTHHAVVTALATAGLDIGALREILPRQAFTRACTKLEKDRVIDPAPQHNLGDILAYQFSKRAENGDEWKYDTEAIVHVNRDTGKVWCKDAALAEHIQGIVDAALGNRTANDITNLVQKIFRKTGDLFPVRDQGGCYFVPFVHLGLVAQIEVFLKALGGHVNRFPIADARQGGGNRSVVETVAAGLAAVIQEHEAAVLSFGTTTHAATLDAAAEKIKATRVKIEAYASYLEDRKTDLLTAVDAANTQLIARVNAIAGIKNAPEEPIVTRLNLADAVDDGEDDWKPPVN